MSKRWLETLLLIAVLFAIPSIVPNSYIFDVLIRIGLVAIAAIGLNLLMGLAGQISIGHAAFVAGGAYVSGILAGMPGWSAITAIPVAVALMTIIGLSLAVPMLRLSGHALTIATLGFSQILQIFLVNQVEWTGGPDGLATPPLSIGNIAINSDLRWFALVSAVLVITFVLARNLDCSAAGRALRAVRDSEIAAKSVGIGVYWLKVRIFVLSAALAGLSGTLSAHYSGFITPDMTSFLKNVELATIVVVGGRGSTLGALIGAAILTALPQLLGGFADYEMVVFGLILMSTMIFLPEGIVPSLSRRWQAFRAQHGKGSLEKAS